MRITIANNKSIKYACMMYHYAKSVPVNTLGYNVYNDNDEYCGVILYGSGANNNIGKSYNLLQGQILELVRVALNGKQSSVSQALAMTLKQIKKDCPLVKLIVSYADMDQEHIGTIYQATNWVYVGDSFVSKKDGSYIINGNRKHGKSISNIIAKRGGLNGLTREQYIRKYLDVNAVKFITKGKRKYLYPLDKKTRKLIESQRLPYPKTNDNWVKIDRQKFKEKETTDIDNI